MNGNFYLRETSDGKYLFTLRAKNGEIILRSEIFKSKKEALLGIEAVIESAKDDDAFKFIRASDGGIFFILQKQNGETIATSQMYRKIETARAGILAVKANAIKETGIETPNKAPIEKIGSVTTFLRAIGHIAPEKENTIFFRGHGSSEYKLIPSIYRNSGWIRNEHTMFYELMLKCPGDFNMSGSTFNTLVKMQHYSLPTRLLDITANPLIALYFACEDGEHNDAEVVALRISKEEIKYYDSDTVSVIANISRMPPNFSLKSGKNIPFSNANTEAVRLVREIQREKPYFENRVRLEDACSVVCVKPMLDNPRIIKQDGAFLIFGMDGNKTKSANIPEKYLASKNELRMIVNGADKRKILQQLELLGITRSSIFPEIENVAIYIRDAHMDYEQKYKHAKNAEAFRSKI